MRRSRSKPETPATPPGRQRLRSTDWQRPAAYSYHEQRSAREDNPERQATNAVKQRRQLLSLRYWARRGGAVTALLIAVVILLSVLSLSTQPRIVSLSDTNSDAATADYQQAAAKQLATSVWNRNKLTFDSAAASKSLQQAFPELAQVTVTVPLIGHRPTYYLRANQPAFLLQSTSGGFVLDTHGTALMPTDQATEKTTANLPAITDQTGLHVATGKQIISSSQARFIQTVSQVLAARSVTVASIVLPAGSVDEMDLHVAGKAYAVKFDMHDPSTARQQTGTYLAIAGQLARQNVTPAQYIDVRVLGRGYYQ